MERIIGTDLHWRPLGAELIELQNMAQYSKSVYRHLFAFSKAMHSQLPENLSELLSVL